MSRAGKREHLVFVYGSLRRGEYNHGLLVRARFIEEARTPPCFELVDLGAFPAMIEGGAVAVIGEVYTVNPSTLRRLDELEGHPHLYQRCRIRLASGREVETYLMDAVAVAHRPRIPSGDWCKR
jgi:gamma-glutamylaminecyclotransferase